MKRVLLAMSGGVDSSAAAVLLHREGFEVVGCTMQLWDYRRNPSRDGEPQFGKCCSLDDVYDARRVAESLGFPFYVLNLEKQFQRKVVEPFIDSYLRGKTPIPCTLCNTFLKFDRLMDFAAEIGIDCVATGHYARVQHDPDQGYVLLKAKDPAKDQSYYLFELTQKQLSRISFPVGDYDKPNIRELAASRGLLTANKPESQEICFVPDGDYASFIRRHATEVDSELAPLLSRAVRPGPILLRSGERVGTHSGLHRFTVGQRRGLGIAHSSALYVLELDTARNVLLVGERQELYARGLVAEQVNWISSQVPQGQFQARVRIRSRHQEALATIELEGANGSGASPWGARVFFDEPQAAVSPGQAAVFYDGERLLGGGWITGKI